MVDSAAQKLVGVPFRLHGRDPATGLDCIGVVAFAADLAMVPTGYRMRQGTPDAIIAGLDTAGLERVSVAAPGDVLLFKAGPAQFHLGVKTDRGFVHACALLRRVVETPEEPGWPLIGAWRRKGS